MAGAAYEVPAHVPADRVRDVDLYDLPGAAEDVHLAWKQVQDECPAVYFTPRHGGYWVVTRAELLEQLWPDYARLSSADGAIGIPRTSGMPSQLPIEVDPPNHGFYRSPINIALSPKAVQGLTTRARALAIELIEGLLPRGECEFVHDFAAHLPMEIFLSIVDLPLDDREWLIARTEIMTRGGDGALKQRTLQEVFGYLASWIDQRTMNPGSDLISRIVQLKVGDRPITRDEALSECALVMFGGLDTVAGSMSFVARFLATHPEHRHQLITQPQLIPKAIDELMRRFAIPTVGRHLTEDVTVDGVTMKAGDYVQMTTCFHGLDERVWPNPLEVDFNRNVADRLLSFGKGVHKCPGANLARSEMRVFLEEWLKRIPEFSIKPGAKAITATGAVAGVLHLPLVWPAA
jgi:cytochrome P450